MIVLKMKFLITVLIVVTLIFVKVIKFILVIISINSIPNDNSIFSTSNSTTMSSCLFLYNWFSSTAICAQPP